MIDEDFHRFGNKPFDLTAESFPCYTKEGVWVETHDRKADFYEHEIKEKYKLVIRRESIGNSGEFITYVERVYND